VGYDFAGAASKVNQQVKFFWRQAYRALAHLDGASCWIDSEVTKFDGELLGFSGSRPPEIRPHSREQLFNAERLGNVIIRARVERFDFGSLLAAHGEHENRNLTLHPDPPAKFQSIHVGHSKIGDDQVGRPVLHDFQRCLAIVGDANVISVAGE